MSMKSDQTLYENESIFDLKRKIVFPKSIYADIKILDDSNQFMNKKLRKT